MPNFGLIGSSYTSQSPNASDSENINWYYEAMEQPAKVPATLYPTPGTTAFYSAINTPARGVITAQDPTLSIDRTFAVMGSHFVELHSDGTATDYGTVLNNSSLCSMTYGPTQVFFSSVGFGYVFDLIANTLTALPTSDFNGGNISFVGYCDGFFTALRQNSNIWQVSGLFDATSWDALDFTAISTFPGAALAMNVSHREVWFFGARRSIVYYDSGNVFPFDVIPGSDIETGIAAPKSVVNVDNSVLWIGGDERGVGVGWRAVGYTPVRITNHAEEYLWSTFPTIADAEAYAYQDQGHQFWVIYFPSANRTRVYDVATKQWHERAYFNTASGQFEAHHSRCHTFNFGKHLVGSPFAGEINQMSINFYTDVGGNPIRRVRRSVNIGSEEEWLFHHQVQIDCETGLGPIPPLTDSSSYPSSYIVQDSSTQKWVITMDDTGAPQTTPVGSGTLTSLIVNDLVTPNASWQFGVDTLGALTITSVTYSAGYPSAIPIASSPSLFDFQLQVSAGAIQTAQGQQTQPRDPQMNLRWSDDGGHTWSNTLTAGCGQAGVFKKRVMFYRLGRSRDRVYEISVTDPIPWRIVGGYLKASGPVPARAA